MTHPLFAWLLLLTALFYPSFCAAAVDQQHRHLHQLRMNIIGSLGDFYLLYGVDSDPAHSASIDRRLALADSQLAQLGDAANADAQSPLGQLQAHWLKYRALLTALTSQLQRQRVPEGGAIAELIGLNRHLLSLCDSLSAISAAEPAPLASHSRALELQLQTLTTAYIAHSVGANSLGGDAPGVDEQSQVFAAGLQRLRQQPEQSAQRQRLLQDIEQKWRYIEPSLRNYRHNNVPSLVNRYSARIIAELGRLADMP